MNHIEVGSKVLITKPRWVPRWLARKFDPLIGENAVVVGIEVGKYCGDKVYSVYVEHLNKATCYFNDRLTPA